MPQPYALEGAFPNPFRETATLRFALPERAEVDLAVYDLTGRVVARLAGGEHPAGYHDVSWEARGLAAGVYLVRLTAGPFSPTRRVVLLR